MTIALVIFSTLIALMATMSALGKLTKMERALESVKSVGVKDSQIAVLGILELLGAIGLVVGIWIPAAGQLAALGLVIYFVVAAIAHLRASHEVRQVLPALFLMVISLVTMVLQWTR